MDYTTEPINHEFKCPMCDELFKDDISLIDHFTLVHCENVIDEIVDNHLDDNKSIDYSNNSDYDSNNSDYDSDEYYERVYKESEYGEYECKICSRKFISNERLNDHFMSLHSSYDDTLQLDETTIGGFPGFNILQHMDVFNFTTEPINNICPICLEEYEINDIVKEKESFDYSKYIDDDDSTNNYPVKIHCCNQCLCCQCLREHIRHKNKITCPFCQYNYEISNGQFLIIPKCENIFNKSLWIKWRENHPL